MPEPHESLPARREEVHAAHTIAALAAAQDGVVSRRQLLGAGLTSSAIGRWMAQERLVPLHRGVYAVGHARLTRDGYRWGALLAAGPGAALSHREAAAQHALIPPTGVRVELTSPHQRRVPGARIHRARLDDADVSTVDGLAVTTVARTLVDLAAVVSPHRLRKALEEAERSRRLDVRAIEAVLERTRGRNGRGHAAVRAALAELAATGTTVTRSTLEDRFLALLVAHGLPRPAMNANVDGIEVDAVWSTARLVVELDGWGYHRTRQAFQRDRDRSNGLTAKGWTVLRFTHHDVIHRPAATARRIAQAARATG
jgi:predicted transcriptional regulator of viral defense system